MLNKLKVLLFQNQSQGQTIFKNFFWLLAGQIGSRLIRAFIIVYAARVLGAAEYGVFSYVLGLTGFFTIFADLGVGGILTRETAKDPERANNYFAAAFWLKIIFLVFTALLIIFLAPHFSNIEAAKTILPFMALLNFFDGIRELCLAFFRGKQKMELEALIMSVTNVSITIFGLVILHFFASAQALSITYALSASTGAILGVIILKEQFSKIFSAFRMALARLIMKSALPIALISVMGIFMINTDIVMLGFFRTAEEIGFYSASQKIIQLIYVLPSLLASVLFPAISRFVGSGDNRKSAQLAERGIVSSLLIAIPLALGGFLLSRGIITFLYGEAYAPATLSFQILALTTLINYPGVIIGNYIFAYNQQGKVLIYVLSGALSNVLLNLLFIPRYGIGGAALATFGAQIIYNGSIWHFAKRMNNFYVFRHLKKIILSTAIMGLLTFTLQKLGVGIIANISISVLVYASLLYLLKEKILHEIISLIKR